MIQNQGIPSDPEETETVDDGRRRKMRMKLKEAAGSRGQGINPSLAILPVDDLGQLELSL